MFTSYRSTRKKTVYRFFEFRLCETRVSHPLRIFFSSSIDYSVSGNKTNFRMGISNVVTHTESYTPSTEWFWPSSRRYVPLMGLQPQLIYAAKRHWCLIKGAFFEYKYSDMLTIYSFLAYKVFLSALSNIISRGPAALFSVIVNSREIVKIYSLKSSKLLLRFSRR